VSLLDAGAVAERLGISRPSVRRLWDQRQLPFVEIPAATIGRRIRRTDATVLEIWINNHSFGCADDSKRGAS